jgi:beta-lactamase class D
VIAGLIVLLFGAGVSSQSPVHSCLVVAEGSGAAQRWAGSAVDCATRLSPASTYKIPHALIGLETGVITTATIEKWDGVRHPQQPKWNQDHTVLTSMKPSVLWFFQRMAPRIGAGLARGWLQRFQYGNADTSGAITLYWVNHQLQISPDEQLAFLRRFYAGELPVSKTHLDAVTGAIEQAPGTVENARGVHQLAARWRVGITLSSKTGATMAAGAAVSWLVGQLTIDGRRLVFASAVWRTSEVDGLEATRLAIDQFVARGILARATAPRAPRS